MAALGHSCRTPPEELRREWERARRRLDRAVEAWREASAGGTLEPPDARDVSATRSWLADATDQARACRAELRGLATTRAVLRSLGVVQWSARFAHRLLKLDDGQRWASGVLAAAVLAAPFAVLYGLISLPAAWFVTLFLCTFAVFVVLAVTLNKPSSIGWLSARLERNYEHAATVRVRLADAADQIKRLAQHLDRVTELHDRHAALAEARDELAQLQALLDDQRYQLLHADWRSLRGVPFEQFLERVFRVLGYEAIPTKASGDQGVDLIVTGKGRRIAVQAKGYGASVGNKAVQEAYAGMAFYKCDECVVITNSQFTSGGRELASAVGCVLIDGTLISDLIEGRIY